MGIFETRQESSDHAKRLVDSLHRPQHRIVLAITRVDVYAVIGCVVIVLLYVFLGPLQHHVREI